MRDDKRSILSTRSEMAQTTQFTLAQVKGHNNGTDLWIVIRDKVYDVTKFQNEHPGGEEVLIEVAGKDATTEFDDVGHSDSAIELMANYLVGEIVDADKRSKVTAKKKVYLGLASAGAVALGAYIIYKGYKLLKSA